MPCFAGKNKFITNSFCIIFLVRFSIIYKHKLLSPIMIEVLLYILVLATAYPIGLLLAWLCQDELKGCKRYFMAMIYLLLLFIIGFLLFYRNISAILAMFYMIVVFWVMVLRARKS